jgi:hypothetical protein
VPDEQEKINPSAKHGFFLEWATQSPPWPLQKIKDKQGRDTGIIGINAPFIKYYYNVCITVFNMLRVSFVGLWDRLIG